MFPIFRLGAHLAESTRQVTRARSLCTEPQTKRIMNNAKRLD